MVIPSEYGTCACITRNVHPCVCVVASPPELRNASSIDCRAFSTRRAMLCHRLGGVNRRSFRRGVRRSAENGGFFAWVSQSFVDLCDLRLGVPPLIGVNTFKELSTYVFRSTAAEAAYAIVPTALGGVWSDKGALGEQPCATLCSRWCLNQVILLRQREFLHSMQHIYTVFALCAPRRAETVAISTARPCLASMHGIHVLLPRWATCVAPMSEMNICPSGWPSLRGSREVVVKAVRGTTEEVIRTRYRCGSPASRGVLIPGSGTQKMTRRPAGQLPGRTCFRAWNAASPSGCVDLSRIVTSPLQSTSAGITEH